MSNESGAGITSPDSVEQYGLAVGFVVCPRTVLVEGTSDVGLFQMAASFEREASGVNLFGKDLAIVAAGERDRGGTHGVIRELISFRGMSRTCLQQNGQPRYRFIGLFDNDTAGRNAVKMARQIDSSILEFKDVFRLWPTMPLPGNLDVGSMQNTFERENNIYKGLDWELEDLLPEQFIEAFLSENTTALSHRKEVSGKVHRDFTPDGKAKLHRFIKIYATYEDLQGVINVLKALRYYLNLRPPAESGVGGQDQLAVQTEGKARV